MTVKPTVPIVEDDDAVRESLVALLEVHDYSVEAYSSGDAFLDSYTPRQHDCVVLDVRLPGINGIEVLERLSAANNSPQVVMITGHGDWPIAVRAIRAGAFDFLEKPYKKQVLLDCIDRALTHGEMPDASAGEAEAATQRLNKLSPTEHDILRWLIDGKSHDEIARKLDVSSPIVSRHRSSILEKLRAHSFGEAIGLAFAGGLVD